MSDYSPGQKKLISHISKRYPSLSDKETASVLKDIKSFVNLSRKIYTEPQAIVSYKTSKNNKGENELTRTFTTDLNELAKVRDKESKQEPLLSVFRKLHTNLTKVKPKNI